MIKLLSKIFSKPKETEELQRKVVQLETKLAERQEVINRTNAYWKKRLRDATRKSPAQ